MNLIRNQKGLSLFEVLISITVGSVMIMMLLSLLSTTLLTRNEMDYRNILSEEMHRINETLNNRFRNLGYRSILDVSPEGGEHYVFVLTEEYDFVQIDGVNEIDWIFDQYVMHFDLLEGALYYGPYDEYDFDALAFDNPTLRRLNRHDVVFDAQSTIEVQCLGTFPSPQRQGEPGVDAVSATCARAYIRLNFHVSYVLRDGVLPSRRMYSTLIF